MWWIIGVIFVLVVALFLAFIKGAGDCNKAYDAMTEMYFQESETTVTPEVEKFLEGYMDPTEQGRNLESKFSIWNDIAKDLKWVKTHILNKIKVYWSHTEFLRRSRLSLHKEFVKLTLEVRIKELNQADAIACEHRWDMTKPSFERSVWREESNQVTFARQELERILKSITDGHN